MEKLENNCRVNIRNLTLFILAAAQLASAGTISGPSNLIPGQKKVYSWTPGTNENMPVFSLSFGAMAYVTLNTLGWNQGVYQAEVTVNPPALNFASFVLTVTFSDASSNTATDTKNVNVDPYLWQGSSSTIPSASAIFPGNQRLFGIDDPNWSRGCTPTYNFTLNDPSHCSGCGSNMGSMITLNCGTLFNSSAHTSGNFVLNSSMGCGSTTFNMPVVTIPIKLADPTMSGPTSVNCNGGATPNLVYSVTNTIPGANHFVWVLPSGWIFQGNSTGPSVVVTADGTNIGSVKVQALAQSGSLIRSNQSSLPVACCPGLVNMTSDVFSSNTDHGEGISVAADNSVYSGATAIYHGSFEVLLKPGFEAIQGCIFRAYNEGCTGNFQMRLSTQTEPGVTQENIPAPDMTEPTEEASVLEYNRSIKVYPNPHTKVFQIQTDWEGFKFIKVYSTSGALVYKMESISSNIVVNLENAPNGLYLLKIFDKSGQVISKKITRE